MTQLIYKVILMDWPLCRAIADLCHCSLLINTKSRFSNDTADIVVYEAFFIHVHVLTIT